ncbi:uncharacterized protein LOC126425029 [Schistocerca serialis cubense]|uniref:uncharacterized protein LOC126425029 n=1 Tax=Schistocerca serialis cubense TaxID=2023355 RepID=UPI00214ED361|nr:uncharacterized protein LOC126425029 [Schistocerca serialis cubense]
MESAGERDAVAVCGEVDIKEEPILTEPSQQPCEEDEHIIIKEENIIFEDSDACDPLQMKKEDGVSEEEITSPHDAVHIKEEPEFQSEVELTSCASEPERLYGLQKKLIPH